MRYLHTMVRVRDIDESLDFYCNKFGLEEIRRTENEKGRFTLIFLAAPDDKGRAVAERAPELELTYNWDPETYTGGRNFGHLAYVVDNIYATCQKLQDSGVICRIRIAGDITGMPCAPADRGGAEAGGVDE